MTQRCTDLPRERRSAASLTLAGTHPLAKRQLWAPRTEYVPRVVVPAEPMAGEHAPSALGR
eukprot:15354948-Alexandrium_andersonii.AAC.1